MTAGSKSQSTDGRLGAARLNAAERLFIWGFRALARPDAVMPTYAEVCRVFDHFRVQGAVAHLEVLIDIFACTSHRAIELHCPHCAHLSESEYCILRAGAAAQRGQSDAARGMLDDWLPPLATEWASSPLRGITTIFRIADLLLPERFDRPAQRAHTESLRTWVVGSSTLH